LLLFTAASSGISQTNSVNFELALNAQAFAVSNQQLGNSSYVIPIFRYEHKTHNNFLFSVGFSNYHQQFGWYYPFMINQILIPLRLCYVVGRKKNMFEAGLGIMPGYCWSLDAKFEPNNPVLFYPEIITGYRFEPDRNNLLFRTGISHEIEYFSTLAYNPCPYISAGWKF
jgi:hypothetical protein